MNAKLTPWFPGDVKPVRVGVYEKLMPGVPTFQYWNSRFWCGWACSVDGAQRNGDNDYKSSDQLSKWRGLAEPPK